MSSKAPDPASNHLLATLAAADRDRLRPHLEPVDLLPRQALATPDAPITSVVFPLSGALSLLAAADEAVLEVALVGREGMIGLPVVLGTAVGLNMRVTVQVPGTALRLSADLLRAELERNAAFRALLLRYAQALFSQVMQSAICNRLHPVEERLARWLLMTRDRADDDELPLTQEFISLMLGVRRPGVTVAAGVLHKAGLIRCSYGRITVTARERLEASACGCYRIVREQYERLLG